MKPINSNLICRMLTHVLCSMMMVFAFVGCEHNAYNPNNDKVEKPNSFDFSTTSTIQVDVKYDVPKGYKVLFEVYDEDPYTTDEDGQIVKRDDLEPIVRRMTDENGAYSGKEIIEADHNNEVYIYTSYIGVPGLFKTSLNNNVINANINWETASNSIQTRAARDVPAGYNTLGSWDQKGRPNYLDSEGKLELSQSLIDNINKTVPEKGTCPAEYRQSTDFIVKNPQGSKTEISVRFIGGTSSAASTFGYYCYKDGDDLAKIKNAKKYIVFPNTLTIANKKPTALTGGECVKLHYIDEQGVDQGTEFPNGTKIGWFLVNDGFMGKKETFYSTPGINGASHTAAFKIGDFIVLSFEDWKTEQDYNDVMFNIWSNPIEALPDVPEVPEDNEKPDDPAAYSVTYKGIVAFEDNWPYKKDYDLNDVVVKYNSILNFNDKNEVLSTEDTYELLWSGASFKNGFAYQLNTERSNVKTDMLLTPTTFSGQGLDTDLTQATINVLLSAFEVTDHNTKTETYKVKNTLKTPIDHEVFGVPPYNPFIMVHDNLGKSRIEVHLVNHAPTEKADMNLFGTGDDLSSPPNSYYVASGAYPFAINLSNAEKFSTPETHPIDTSFEHFKAWVNSNGEEHKDWYK